MLKLVTFGALCVAAMFVAAMSSHERRCLFTAALIILGDWLLFSMPWIYAPASLPFVAWNVGVHIHQIDAWALIDLCAMICLIGCCWRVWWGPLLWLPLLVNLVMYAVAYANHLDYIHYQNVLDASLSVQLAAVFLVGGPGCADRLSRCWSLRRVVRCAPRDVAMDHV
jgi:hypothetical protein